VSDSTSGETDDERRARGMAPDPLLPGQEPPEITVPKPVAISFWLWVAAGVILVTGQILLLSMKNQLIDEVTKQVTSQPDQGVKLDPAQIASGLNTLLWTLLVGSIVFAALFALFAYKAREGTRSARSVLTGLAVFLVLIELIFFRGALNLFLVLSTLLAAIALMLMYLPSVANHFPKVGRKLP
jgi:hypothetical protein